MSATVMLTAYRLKRYTMGGAEWEHTVYVDKGVADLIAAEKHEEWVHYTAHDVQVRVLSELEGAVGYDLVAINRLTEDEAVCMAALRKLTAKERRALEQCGSSLRMDKHAI